MEPTSNIIPGMVFISKRITDEQKDKDIKSPELFFLEEWGFTYDEVNDVFQKNKLILPKTLAQVLTEDMKDIIDVIVDNDFFFISDPMNDHSSKYLISNHYSIFDFFESISAEIIDKNKIQKKLDKTKNEAIQ